MQHGEAGKAAVRAIVKALEGGAPFVRIGGADGFLLCLRRRGQEIEDPEGYGAFETLCGGVFRRFKSIGPDGDGYRWLFLGPCDERFIADALQVDLEAMSASEIAAIPADMAFQTVRAQDAAKRGNQSGDGGPFNP